MSSQSGNAQALPTTNQDFLKAIFGNSWYLCHVTGFAGDPQDPGLPRSVWEGGGAGSWVLSPQENNYFSVSLFTGRRDQKYFEQLVVLAVDDVGPKVSVDKLNALPVRPSFRIETSPGNEQWGYAFETPITVLPVATALIDAMAKYVGINDARGVTRYLRLPVGTNGKPAAQGWHCRLLELGDKVSPEGQMALGLVLSVALTASEDNPSPNVVPGPGATRRSYDDLVEHDRWFRAMRKLDLVLGGPRNSAMGRCYDIVCPWVDEHTGRADSGTAYVPVVGRFECHHGHCADRTGADLPARLDALLKDQSGWTWRLVDEEFDELPDEGARMRASPPLPPADPWWEEWQRTARGVPASNLENVLIALRRAPEFVGLFSFDAFSLRGTLCRELPDAKQGAAPVPREWRDVDTVILQSWLQRQGLRSVARSTVDEAVGVLMAENAHHPLREWLEGLTWDGTARLDSWLSTYVGTPQDAYHSHTGAWFLMGMCRRVAEPGCRMDYMLILEGPQGIGKSTMLRTLAGEDAWFSDNLPDIATKEASEHMAGRWLVEVAELDRFNRAESGAMKAFVSRATDRHRLPFARRTADFPRQGVLAGTVNHGSYFKDETGNRRYWPVVAGAIDLVGLATARAQLFAEAWDRAIRCNEPYWPDPMFEGLFLQPAQDARLEADLWEPTVLEFLEGKDRVLIGDVVVACTGGSAEQMSTRNRNRVTDIMGSLKWRRGLKGPNNERFWYPNGTKH